MAGSFVDLRLNSRGGQSNEGFWPSFTDIMTVVVMIFMMAMLLLLLKNMNLVHRLQATLAAEHAASKQALKATSKNADLQQQLQRAERELGMLQMQLMSMSDERDRLSSALAASKTALAKTASEKEDIASRLAASQEQLALKNTQYAALTTELARNRQALARSRQALALNRQDMARMHENEARINQQLASLSGEYKTLKFKYDKLVRPARTAKGKYVAMVRVSKVNGQVLTELKTPGQAAFAAVSRTRLHQRLKGLRQRHSRDLYVKIIFPEHSGLSYSEAWKLTESLLRKYDYYYHTPEESGASQ